MKTPPKLLPPICSHDWNKMTRAERDGRKMCRCWHTCWKLNEEAEARRDQRILRRRQRGSFWQRVNKWLRKCYSQGKM